MQLEPNNLIKKYELAEGQKDYIKNRKDINDG